METAKEGQIKRYELRELSDWGPDLVEDPEGEWVRYEDVKPARTWAAILCATFLVLALLVALTGCTTYHERDGRMEPNKPSAEELREICPM